jgi:GT2 family glycosyltransferase
VVRLKTNLGYARGMNAGLKLLEQRSTRRILMLNPDTTVDPCFLAPLEQALAEGAGLAGSKLLSPGQPPRIWSAGGEVTFGLNLSRLRGHREVDHRQYDRAEDVTFLPGTVWLLDREVLTGVGYFDERFFCYVEDVDYCLRVIQAGWRIRYVPESVVVHEGSQASGGGYTPLRKYLNALGSWALLRKHGSPMRWATFLLCDVLTAPGALIYGMLRHRPGAAWWKLRGLVDGALNRPFSERRREQLLTGADR